MNPTLAKSLLALGAVMFLFTGAVAQPQKLPVGHGEVILQTVLVVREDSHTLYGFFTRSEKDLFNLLVNHVSGVGPKLALAVLNGCSPSQFRGAVVAGCVPDDPRRACRGRRREGDPDESRPRPDAAVAGGIRAADQSPRRCG